MSLDCSDLIKVHSLLLWPRDETSASIRQYTNANSCQINVTNWWSPNGNASYLIFMFFIIIFFIYIVGGGVQTGSTRHVGHLLAYCTCPGWLWGWRIWWNEWQGKPKYSEKTCPGATLSTTNPTWPDPGLNLGCCGGKPATNCFSYGAASIFMLL
jgi:hypothetical protein